MAALGKFIVIALVSSGITTVVSTIYITLCCLVLIYRSNCFIAQIMLHNSDYFLFLIYRQYIKDDICLGSLAMPDLMHSDTVYVLTSVSLAMTAASLAAALSLIVTIFNKEYWYYLNLSTYVHMGFFMATLIVDMIFAIYFALDYITLTDKLNASDFDEPTNYLIDMMRIGALFLIALTMKGFMAHAINIALLVPLIYYLPTLKTKEEHLTPVQRVFNTPIGISEPRSIQHSAISNLDPGKNLHPRNHTEEVSQTSDRESLPGSSLPGNSTPQTNFGISPHRPFTYSEGLTPTLLRSKSSKSPKPYTPNPDYG